MKNEKQPVRTLRVIQSTLSGAISQLDLRGTDEQITKTMGIIDAVLEAAILGEEISAKQAFKRGVRLARFPR